MFGKWFGGGRVAHTRITFERTGEHVPGCPRGIYTIKPDGGDIHHIRPTGQTPRWSPNGHLIAFCDTTPDNGGLQSIFIMRPDGTHVQRLTNHDDVDATPPSWSSDSKWLAYSLWLWNEQRYQLCVVDVATRQWRHVLYTDDAVYPVWSPSDWIMYSCRTGDGNLRLVEVDPCSAQIREANGFEPGDSEPIWTPDGRTVVFGREGGVGITDASGQTQVIRTKGTAVQWAVEQMHIASHTRHRKTALLQVSKSLSSN